MSGRARLDAELVRRGLAPSRTTARALVDAGLVTVDGIPTPKPSSQVTRDQSVRVEQPTHPFASRGGLKLDGALDDLAVDPSGALALDAGAAHGGFTDVLLRRGAAHVIAVDVAYGQLDWRIRNDDRVSVLERTNVRHLTSADLGDRRPDLVVADLSFISLVKVLPALISVAAEQATLLVMVKPQFELDARAVGKGGVVREPASWREAMQRVAVVAAERGFALLGAAPSRAPGPAGNIEFFLLLRRQHGVPGSWIPDDAQMDDVLQAAVSAGIELRRSSGRR